jgi:hypothetical protein
MPGCSSVREQGRRGVDGWRQPNTVIVSPVPSAAVLIHLFYLSTLCATVSKATSGCWVKRAAMKPRTPPCSPNPDSHKDLGESLIHSAEALHRSATREETRSELDKALDQYVVVVHSIPQCLNIKQDAQRHDARAITHQQDRVIHRPSTKTVDKFGGQSPTGLSIHTEPSLRGGSEI